MNFSGAELGLLLVQYVCLLFSLSFHEAAHSMVADRCGDPTGRLMGRSTLNPIAHIDPIGTLILPLLLMFTGSPFLFGWAKPVPYNPRNLRNFRRDPALVGLAGPAANLVLAITFAIFLRIVVVLSGVSPDNPMFQILFLCMLMMVLINLALMLFNLIPVPPLDGHHLLYSFLPYNGQRMMERIGPFGIIIAIVLANRILPGPLEALRDGVLWFAFWGRG